MGEAYEVADVTLGGTLRGRVFLKGTPPPAKIYHLIFSPNIEFCSSISDGKGNRLLREFRASADGGFQDVVVAVVGVQAGKPFGFTPKIEIENCRISPFVTPVRNHHPISITSNDPVTHDIQAYTMRGEYTYAMFNKPAPEGTDVLKEVRLRKGHYIFRTQCGVHDYMQSWGIAVGNPYFSKTDNEGYFEITDIPPGTYFVIAWHPRMDIEARRITIRPGGQVVTTFEFDAKEVKIPIHDLQTTYRLDTALQPHHLVPPSVELQIH